MKLRSTAIVLLVVAALTFSTGCAETGDKPAATTQPTLVDIVIGTQAAVDLAVNAIHLGLDLQLIDGTTYWRDIDPAVVAAQAACASMRASATAGDVSAADAASKAALAAVQKIRPYVVAVQSKSASAVKAK